MNKTVPAISIVIPMFNVENYIRECLDSILAQTFTDYEVIAVDDYSTDRTCEIVERYIPKFKGKLQLIRSQVNSGGAGIPRNKGISYSLGKWLFLMDADDVITPTAIAELYEIAEKYDVDMLHCEKMLSTIDDTDEIPVNQARLTITSGELGNRNFVTEPTFMSEDLADRIDDYTKLRFWNAPWAQFYRRDFVAKNNLKFPKIGIADDVVFNFYAICLAKDIVRIPNTYYVWRKNPNSNVRAVLSIEKGIHRYAHSIMQGIAILDEFMDTLDFFKNDYKYRYAVFDLLNRVHIGPVVASYTQNQPYEIDPLLRKEIAEIKNSIPVTAFLFSQMCVNNALLMLNMQKSTEKLNKQKNLLHQQREKIQEYQTLLQNQATQIRILKQKLGEE